MTPLIVRFAAALTRPDVERLRAAYNLKLDRYIPSLGYLERLSAATVQALRDDFLVRSCTPLDPALKLSPSISDLQPVPGSPLEFSATLFEDADVDGVRARLAAAGASDVQMVDDRPISGGIDARFMIDDVAVASDVAAIDDVLWIEPVDAIASQNVDAAETIQSGTVAKSPIWDHGLHGENQIIGVIDEGGLGIDHCFFADAAPNKPGASHRKVIDIFNESGSPVALHPTQVCGVAVGDERGNTGAHVHRGGAWNAKLVYSNVLDLHPPKSRSMRHLLDRAGKSGAVIHSNSWGNSKTSLYDKRAQDVDAFSWANEEHLVVAAGANTGEVNAPPGTAKNALCVAAAKPFPNEMSRATGVDGPTADRRRKPEIMAVGAKLEMADPTTTCGFRVASGTSFATPHVAAAAALVRQYFLEGFYPTGKRQSSSAMTPSGALVKAVLLNSTVDMTGEAGYPSNAEGWGLIRLNRTLFFAGGKRQLAVKDVRRAVGLDVGDELTRAADWRRNYSLFVNDRSEQLKITLVWTDPPPSEQAFINPALNSIKLTATPDEPDLGESYVGNDIDTASGLSRPEGDGPLDTVNNVQMIIVNNPPIGPWTITVSTKSIWVVDKPHRQGYALVASGGLDLLGFLTPR